MKLIFRVHALQRMFEREISRDCVAQCIETGEVIEEYPADQPTPSKLILGWVRGQPIHVVASDDVLTGETIVITVYRPDATRWHRDFKRRKA